MDVCRYVVLVLLCSASASALSLSIPQDRHFTFEPNLNVTVVFQVQNNDGIDQEVSFYANGDLSEYVRFEPTNKVFLKAGEAYAFAAIFELPVQIPPGEHVPVIGASGKGGANLAMIGATTAVQVRVFFRGRHPGKFIRPSLEIFPQEMGIPMKFEIEYKNLGSEAVSEVASRIDVYDLHAKFMGLVNVEPVELLYDGSRRVSGVFETKSMSKGRYMANLTMIVDGGVVENAVTTEFRLGNREVLISGHTGRLEQGLSLMRMNVSSDWNQDLDYVFVLAEIKKGAGHTVGFQTPSVTLKPFQTLEIEGYLDLTNATLGTNALKATVHYTSEDLKREYSLPVTVVRKAELESPRMFTDKVVMALIGLIIVLIVMNMFWFAYTARMRREKSP